MLLLACESCPLKPGTILPTRLLRRGKGVNRVNAVVLRGIYGPAPTVHFRIWQMPSSETPASRRELWRTALH